MKNSEILTIIFSIIIFTLVISFKDVLSQNFLSLGTSLLFASVIVLASISAKKITAHKLDAEITHELWTLQRFGFKPSRHLRKKIPMGLIAPILISIFSLGLIKFTAFLTYEATALKRRAARRHGFYSYTEMTDWHMALIGSSGVIAVLLLSFISYFIPNTGNLPAIAAYYTFWNLIPISKLDGAQIFFGSRVLWTTLAIISIIFTTYGLLLV